ncbi:MAG: hypothetical protein QHH07_12880, partial [Sedimentisphaerales bacterium]|nr:hypothetical protein [Sedimentisphaerales bacterium]
MKKSSNINLAIVACGLVFAICYIGGCGGAASSSGHQKATGVAASLLKAKVDMAKLKDQIVQTNAALKHIITDP